MKIAKHTGGGGRGWKSKFYFENLKRFMTCFQGELLVFEASKESSSLSFFG